MPGSNAYIWDGDYEVANTEDQEVEFPTEYFESFGAIKKLYGFIVVFEGKGLVTPTYDYVGRDGDLVSDASAATGGNTSATVANLVGSYKFTNPLECYSFKLKLKVLGTSSTYVRIKKVIFKYRTLHDEPGTL